MVEPTPVAREHKKLGDELEDTYNELVNAYAYARGYMRDRKGNINVVYFQFFYPFVAFFQYTRYLREMENVEQDLVKDIDSWINIEGNLKPSGLKAGLDLFSKYQKEVLKAGVIVLKRE